MTDNQDNGFNEALKKYCSICALGNIKENNSDYCIVCETNMKDIYTAGFEAGKNIIKKCK